MSFRSKVFVLSVIMLIIVSVGIGTWSIQNQTDEYSGPIEKITLGVYAGESATLVWIADMQGYFESNGLDVTIREYEAGKLAVDALLAGEVDIATSAEFVLVSNSFDNSELRVLGSVATAEINEVVARSDLGIQHPSDLNGKKIGVTRKSTGEFFLGSFLLFNNLSWQDVEVVDLNPSGIVEAISTGEIEAALTWDPNIYEIKKRLADKAVAWPGQSGQDFYFILVSQANWVEIHPEAAERFLAALIDAEEFVRGNDEEAQRLLQQKFDYDPSYLQYSWVKHSFEVRLPQALLIAMEDEARWMLENDLTEKTAMPNYLNFLYLDGLSSVKPERVTVIR